MAKFLLWPGASCPSMYMAEEERRDLVAAERHDIWEGGGTQTWGLSI